MKKPFIVFASLAILAAGVIACSVAASQADVPNGAPTVLPTVKAGNTILAEGKVVPARSAALGFQVAGTVAEIPVAVGDRVASGQVLAQLDARQLELQLAQAEANLAAAQAKLNQLKRGPSAEDLAAAKQAVASAQAAYDQLLQPDKGELDVLSADIDKAQAAFTNAQQAYDRTGGDANPNGGMLPEHKAMQMAWIDLQRAKAVYNNKLHPPDAQVQQALSTLENAKDQLAKLTPTAEDLAAAQANADASQAARDLATEQVKHAKIVAPFAGTVASIDINPNEQAAAGVSVLRLADNTVWQIETTNLTEINIVNVKEGNPTKITFDAIPGLELTGVVATINGFGDNRQGDIVYRIVVKLDQQDDRLRWNMTAKISIAK